MNSTLSHIRKLIEKRREFEAVLAGHACNRAEFKDKLFSTPKSCLEDELKVRIPDTIDVVVSQEKENTLHFILPYLDETMTSAELSHEQLECVQGGNSRRMDLIHQLVRKISFKS